MQRIVLFDVQFGQIAQLPVKFNLLPGIRSNCGQSENDADRRLTQG
jgi:hypothetical protein